MKLQVEETSRQCLLVAGKKPRLAEQEMEQKFIVSYFSTTPDFRLTALSECSRILCIVNDGSVQISLWSLFTK